MSNVGADKHPISGSFTMPFLHNCVTTQNLRWREQPSDALKSTAYCYSTVVAGTVHLQQHHTHEQQYYTEDALWTHNELRGRERAVSLKPLHKTLYQERTTKRVLYLGRELRQSVSDVSMKGSETRWLPRDRGLVPKYQQRPTRLKCHAPEGSSDPIFSWQI